MRCPRSPTDIETPPTAPTKNEKPRPPRHPCTVLDPTRRLARTALNKHARPQDNGARVDSSLPRAVTSVDAGPNTHRTSTSILATPGQNGTGESKVKTATTTIARRIAPIHGGDILIRFTVHGPDQTMTACQCGISATGVSASVSAPPVSASACRPRSRRGSSDSPSRRRHANHKPSRAR